MLCQLGYTVSLVSSMWYFGTEGLFILKPGWPAKLDSPVSEISLCCYFYSKNYRAFIWTSGSPGPVAEISLERGEIVPTGMEISPYKHSQASSKILPQAIFNLLSKQYNVTKLSRQSGMKYSHINTREIHPAYRAVSLSGPVRLPYKQNLSLVPSISNNVIW